MTHRNLNNKAEMSQNGDKPKSYLTNRPTIFDPHDILVYLDIMDKKAIENEIAFDEAKDQKEEMFDFVVDERITSANESVPISLAKVKANKDDRYRKVKKELSNRKKVHLLSRAEAKNAHSYCDNLKQQSINAIATEKLLKH